MKTATTVCDNCGDKIFEDAPRGLCPACVLETGLGPLADETVAGGGHSGHPARVLKDLGTTNCLRKSGEAGRALSIARARKVSTEQSR